LKVSIDIHASENTRVPLADRTRALPVTDPEDRELTISCGCALFNLRAEPIVRLVNRAVPQIVLRFGYPEGDNAGAPRRPIHDIVDRV
jgi:hypothetical protein